MRRMTADLDLSIEIITVTVGGGPMA
nr:MULTISPECIES: hypothetical protein [unclassified Bradyrhizobium]